jgi:hypothetical protein
VAATPASQPAAANPPPLSFAPRVFAPRKQAGPSQPPEAEAAPPKANAFFAWFARRPKAVTVFAAAAAFLLIAGYVTYLNIPNLAMRVAASRAGFDASLPAFTPSGFKFAGPVAYSEGLITVQFNSNTDARSFKITERKSGWDSQSLLANFVERQSPRYLTFQERGLTIYVFNGSNASWVDGGVWYTIEGDSLLSSEQLLKIAASM